ncbi:MAG: arsenical pump-driving ATPase, partial [Amphiamblys sp. WSBS2006]
NSFPGIDEAMGFATVMSLIKEMHYDTVVFDTAPTGHTLRFFQFPSMLEKALGKMQSMGPLLGSILGSVLGKNNEEQDTLSQNIGEMSKTVKEVIAQFENPDLTTFVCVCIPEFLSLYETERLIQDLAGFKIDVKNIVVNQVLYPESTSECRMCLSRAKMQKKYLGEIDALYDDMHLVKLPLQLEEIRGTKKLLAFSEHLLNPADKANQIN